MQHNFINYGHMDFIIGYLQRYEVGLLKYEIKLRSIHGYLTQGAMNPHQENNLSGKTIWTQSALENYNISKDPRELWVPLDVFQRWIFSWVSLDIFQRSLKNVYFPGCLQTSLRDLSSIFQRCIIPQVSPGGFQKSFRDVCLLECLQALLDITYFPRGPDCVFIWHLAIQVQVFDQ